jgi:ubiquinone/menaquinone biosynthesis C-methylase UbiE
VYSDKGEQIREDEYRASGERDIKNLVLEDEVLKEHLLPFEERIVVEIGCGTGRMSEFLADHFKSVLGLDISAEMVRQAVGRVKKSNVNFLTTNGTTLPVSNVDFVFSFIVFQHMPSRSIVKKNLQQVLKALKPGGVAKIQVRGRPTKWFKWYSGVSFAGKDLPFLTEGFQTLKVSGVGEKYMWLWLKK